MKFFTWNYNFNAFFNNDLIYKRFENNQLKSHQIITRVK